ncbi:MAG: divergent polysaccharide deacetylase family protein [Bacillota bacterium]
MPVLKQISGGLGTGKARVAIVIDDLGQPNETGIKEIISLGIPVTCAVMPNMENTRKHAEEIHRAGHEVIVHLPLEPVNGKSSWLGPGAITSSLSEKEIRTLAKKDFDSVPYAVGFNNHMGSAATSNEVIMRPILMEAMERGFFVLDSRTTDKTVIPLISKDLGIPCIKRDVFLDNINNVQQIKKQLAVLENKAFKKGTAIGIGHVGGGRHTTVKALQEMIPAMKERGIEFVYLSQIVY